MNRGKSVSSLRILQMQIALGQVHFWHFTHIFFFLTFFST